jgi:hypothetical protein
MTGRRQRAFWLIAWLGLPVVNPIVFFLMVEGIQNTAAVVSAGIAVLAVDVLVLVVLARRAWPASERLQSAAVGVIASVVYTAVFAFLEFFAFLTILCAGGGCD